MGEALLGADLRSLVDLLAEGAHDDTGQGLPTGVVTAAHRLVPADNVSFVEFDDRKRATYFDQEYGRLTEDSDPGEELFWLHYWDCMACSYPSHAGDERSVTMISDFYTDRQFHSSGMYADYFSPLRFEREIMLCIRAPAGRTRRLLFFRGPGSDFNERDRLLLTLLRPHLDELYQRLEFRRRGVQNLTRRQRQLLQLVAAGHTNAEIAKRLYISPPTVRKHLENIFERLGVGSRTAAAALAFPNGFVL
jgi:DNA-binding CsgD family transcriptional regulator